MEKIDNETKEQTIDEENTDKKIEEEVKKSEKVSEIVKKAEEIINKESEKEQQESKEITLTQKKEIKTEININKKKSKVTIIIVISVIIIILLAIFSTIFAIINMWNTNLMKGITIGNIDVSNMSKDEAKAKLEEIYSEKSETKIYMTQGELEAVVSYKALEVEFNVDEAVEKAYEIGRKGNIFIDNIEIIKTWINGVNIEVEAVLNTDMVNQMSQNINNSLIGAVVQASYYEEDDKLIITAGEEGLQVNEEELEQKLLDIINEKTEEFNIEIPVIIVEPDEIDIEQIHDEVYKEVQNAYYTQNPFTIYPESNGKDFDVEAAKELLKEDKDEYEISLIITKPTITTQDIGAEAFPDKLATFQTNYSASNTNRTTNLKLAAEKINGTVLLPGEEFSYNKIVGERTIQAGYKEAAIYSNGEVVDGLGGGICQISSTLYDAVVKANLEITERRNHQFVTSYVGAGKDATVVWGSQDFKFKNTREYPIRIEATVSGGVVTVTVWGVKEEIEYDIAIETKQIATISYTTQYIEDSSLPVGTEVVKQAGSNGRKVEAYKVVRLNGQIVSTTLLSTDTYNAMKRIIRVGTGS